MRAIDRGSEYIASEQVEIPENVTRLTYRGVTYNRSRHPIFHPRSIVAETENIDRSIDSDVTRICPAAPSLSRKKFRGGINWRGESFPA
jgi:hypothetical protein